MLEGLRRLFGGGDATESALTARPSPDRPDGPLIQLRDVSKIFEGDEEPTHALRDVSLDVSRGEFVAVRNREVGFIFQSFNLIGDLTVFENVELPLTYLGLPPGERRERVGAVLQRVDMADRAAQMPGQLSGGGQQRVAVARAIVGEPQIILADEPTGNLNSTQAATVVEMLRELHAGGATILLVTHDPR